MALKKGLVPKFLLRRTLDVWMYGYVDAIHSEFPTVSIRKAIEMFRKHYQLEPDDFNEEAAYVTFQRMNAELRGANVKT